MSTSGNILLNNISLLKQKASKQAIFGVGIALFTVVLATLLSAYVNEGGVSLNNIVAAQSNNIALWILDFTPFAFAIWGQYVGGLLAHEAGALVMDQTDDLRSEASALRIQIQRGSMHDTLTGLPNRMLLQDRLEHDISASVREEHGLTVLVITLDRFKEINDSLGHYNADRVLKSFATRLHNVIQPPATLARLGSADFVAILPECETEAAVKAYVAQIRQAMELPSVVEGLSIDLQIRCGAAIFPLHASDADSLMQQADMTMHTAKREGQELLFYNADKDQSNPRRLSLMSELRDAIKTHKLENYYQPIVDTQSGKTLGMEALVRWPHHQHGLIPPSEFIPLAERSPLIEDLTELVLQDALKMVAQLAERGHKLSVSVNFPARVILDPDLPDRLSGQLATHTLEPEQLCLEITEDTLMSDQDRALTILSRISDLGVQIAIDDFGTGYSQLSYMRKLPIDIIKIDRSFVMEMDRSENDVVIVKTAIQLAQNLGLKVVAEGVEQQPHIETLKELNCDRIQGFYISRPMPGDHLLEWLNESKNSSLH